MKLKKIGPQQQSYTPRMIGCLFYVAQVRLPCLWTDPVLPLWSRADPSSVSNWTGRGSSECWVPALTSWRETSSSTTALFPSLSELVNGAPPPFLLQVHQHLPPASFSLFIITFITPTTSLQFIGFSAFYFFTYFLHVRSKGLFCVIERSWVQTPYSVASSHTAVTQMPNRCLCWKYLCWNEVIVAYLTTTGHVKKMSCLYSRALCITCWI